MSEKKSILLAEDDTTTQFIMKKLLGSDYDLTCVNSGKKAIEKMGEITPDIVLLDVGMPDVNGYDTCKWIRQQSEFIHTPIIFISANNTLDDKMEGYNAGGNDYISKPVENAELLAKITAFAGDVEKINSLQNDYKTAFSTAMQAMSSAGELGLIMQFLDQLAYIHSYDEIAHEVFSLMESFGLETSMQIRSTDRTLNFHNDHQINPLEEELLTKVKDKGRFYDSNEKTFVNYETISLLVKNMPLDDEFKYGRIKDNIPPLLNGIDAKIKSIEIENCNKKNQQLITNAIKEVNFSITKANDQLDSYIHKNKISTQELIEEINLEIGILIHDPEIKEKIDDILTSKKDKIQIIDNCNIQLEELFQNITNKLSKVDE